MQIKKNNSYWSQMYDNISISLNKQLMMFYSIKPIGEMFLLKDEKHTYQKQEKEMMMLDL